MISDFRFSIAAFAEACSPCTNPKSRIESRKFFRAVISPSFFLLAVLLAGCSGESSGWRQGVFSQDELYEPYRKIMLKKSMTIDAIPKMQRFQSERGPLLGGIEVLSQSQNITASLGQGKDGRQMWFNMVTFDPYELDVIRKYFFVVDEKAASFPAQFRQGLRFDCEMVLDEKLLSESYASESARRIAILKRIAESLRSDIAELAADANSPNQNNEMLNVCGMMLNQTLETILVKLDASPVLAAKLNESPGVVFDHINFGQGRILMVVVNDLVGIQVRVGAFAVPKKKRW